MMFRGLVIMLFSRFLKKALLWQLFNLKGIEGGLVGWAVVLAIGKNTPH